MEYLNTYMTDIMDYLNTSVFLIGSSGRLLLSLALVYKKQNPSRESKKGSFNCLSKIAKKILKWEMGSR